MFQAFLEIEGTKACRVAKLEPVSAAHRRLPLPPLNFSGSPYSEPRVECLAVNDANTDPLPPQAPRRAPRRAVPARDHAEVSTLISGSNRFSFMCCRLESAACGASVAQPPEVPPLRKCLWRCINGSLAVATAAVDAAPRAALKSAVHSARSAISIWNKSRTTIPWRRFTSRVKSETFRAGSRRNC